MLGCGTTELSSYIPARALTHSYDMTAAFPASLLSAVFGQRSTRDFGPPAVERLRKAGQPLPQPRMKGLGDKLRPFAVESHLSRERVVT